MVWLEPRRVHAGGQSHPLPAGPSTEDLGRILAALPAGPTCWVVDDAWIPALLLRDIVQLPTAAEEREKFFRWRYAQDLPAETPRYVQALALPDNAWLLGGMDEALRESWVQLAAAGGRPMRTLVPRWMWIYNRLAPTREVPGLLISLAPREDGQYSGTLAAWGRGLALLRQWQDPADLDAWHQERVLPTLAYLQRESRTPQEVHVWGAGTWPDCGIPVRIIQPEIPVQETF